MSSTAPEQMDRFYALVRIVGRFWIWFFFRTVDVRHAERVPGRGPVLLCINHPNNLIDSLLVGVVVPRKVHYLATATLFRNPLLARFLRACGVIPIYRKADDPDKMDRNADAIAACWRAFDAGRLVAIYPEGTTHAETRVARIKTGAARIALSYEAQAPGRLTVLPVGLSFEARKAFRGRVLVAFGAPIQLAAARNTYKDAPAAAIEELTSVIQWAMEREVVHVERIDTATVARAVEEIYRGELEWHLHEDRGLSPRQIDPFRLARSIAHAVDYFRTRDPARVEHLWLRLQAYRALLASHRLHDDAVRRGDPAPVAVQLVGSWRAVLGFPLFAYGALVHALPYFVPRWLAQRLARQETDYATIRLLASVVAIPLFWGLETLLIAWLFGLRWAVAFAVSLPLSGLIAFRYLVGAGRLRRRMRFAALLLTHRHEARRLQAERAAILEELDRARRDYLAATKGSSF